MKKIYKTSDYKIINGERMRLIRDHPSMLLRPDDEGYRREHCDELPENLLDLFRNTLESKLKE